MNTTKVLSIITIVLPLIALMNACTENKPATTPDELVSVLNADWDNNVGTFEGGQYIVMEGEELTFMSIGIENGNSSLHTKKLIEVLTIVGYSKPLSESIASNHIVYAYEASDQSYESTIDNILLRTYLEVDKWWVTLIDFNLFSHDESSLR